MGTSSELSARLLDSGAPAYAAHATTRLLNENPALNARFGPRSFTTWKANMTQQIHELAVAVQLQRPEIFAAAVRWARESFAFRQVPESDLRAGLECLREVLRQDLPENLRGEVDTWFMSALQEFGAALPASKALDPNDAKQALALRYMEACLSGDSRGAIQIILDAGDAGLSIESAYLDVLAVAQAEAGRLWHSGKLAVYEEHCVTSVTQQLIAILAHKAPRRRPIGRTVVGAAVQGNGHDVGLRMVMSLFELAGWRSINVGAELPADEYAHAVARFDADVAIISATTILQLRGVRDTIHAVREAAPKAKTLAGGLAFLVAPSIWKQLGADALAPRVSEAVTMANQLVEA